MLDGASRSTRLVYRPTKCLSQQYQMRIPWHGCCCCLYYKTICSRLSFHLQQLSHIYVISITGSRLLDFSHFFRELTILVIVIMTFLNAFTLSLAVLALSQVTAGAIIPPGQDARQNYAFDAHPLMAPSVPLPQYSPSQQRHNSAAGTRHSNAIPYRELMYTRDVLSARRTMKTKHREATTPQAKTPDTNHPQTKPPETNSPAVTNPDAANKPKTSYTLPDGSLSLVGNIIGSVPDYVNLFRHQTTQQTPPNQPNQQTPPNQPNPPKQQKREPKRGYRLPDGSLSFAGDIVTSVPNYVNLFRNHRRRDAGMEFAPNVNSVRGTYQQQKREAKHRGSFPSGSLDYLGTAISNGPSIIGQAEQWMQQQQQQQQQPPPRA